MKNLKEKTIRGGFVKVCAQAASFVVRIGSMMVLARLLEPREFGLVGMVTAITGVLSLFRDFGLSTATVQQASISDDQISGLFWINLIVGTVLSVLALGSAPIIAAFYHEPRLFWVTIVLAAGFFFNAAGVQHSALLQRQMRFTTLAAIEIVSLLISTAVGIGMAIRGYGYWALVGMTLASPFVYTVGVWGTTKWVPRAPRRQSGLRSMMRFGGTITLNSVVVYIAYNFEKVLLGRFWGANAIGIYGRAYQLINIPTDNLNSAVGGVAFSALSRVQDDPSRLRNYFLKGYSFVLALTLPVTVVCAIFARDLIAVLLGPKWMDAVPIFRLLTPTIMIFALINPFAWLLLSLGLVGRSLKIALVIAPLMIAAYVMGLPYGPTGVALAYSVALTLWVIPHIVWCVHGTGISVRDVFLVVIRPLASSLVAAGLALGLQFIYGPSLSAFTRLLLGSTVVLCAYVGMLLYVMGQKAFYLQLFQGLRKPSSVQEEVVVSA